MDAQECLRRGEECFDKDDFDQAIVEFTEAVRLDPNLAVAKSHLYTAYYNRGVTNFQNGENDQAVADFSEAIRFKPDNAAAYDARGMIHNETGNFDGIIEDFTEVIRIAQLPMLIFCVAMGIEVNTRPTMP